MRDTTWKNICAWAKGTSFSVALASMVASHLTWIDPAQAGPRDAFTVYRVICLSALDFFEIRQLEFESIDIRPKVIDRRKEELQKIHGLYSPEWYVRLDVKPTNPEYGIKPKTFECPLSTGLAELVVLPEPFLLG